MWRWHCRVTIDDKSRLVENVGREFHAEAEKAGEEKLLVVPDDLSRILVLRT